MRIAFIGQKGLPVRTDSGGVERHVEELGARIAARGHEVLLYQRPRYARERVTEYRGMKLVRAWSAETKHLDALTGAISATIDAVRRKADVIHYHGIGPGVATAIVKLFAPRISVVITFHSIDRLHQKWGLLARACLRFAEWAAVRWPDATIAVSKSIQQYVRTTYGREILRIPNGAEVRPYPGSDMLGAWHLSPGGYILSVARLVKQKGIHHLIKAYDGFEMEKKLVVVGGGAMQKEYEEALRHQREGNSAVIFTGFQSGRALEQLFANAYLYVQPSEAEGLPVSVIEAMAAGRCVLVSDIPENVEAAGMNGITFVNADADDLRAQLRKLINHPEVILERGKHAQEYVRVAFNWERIAELTEEVYRTVRQ